MAVIGELNVLIYQDREGRIRVRMIDDRGWRFHLRFKSDERLLSMARSILPYVGDVLKRVLKSG